jgi:hypothetical protein
MTDAFVAAMTNSAGGPSPAVLKKILNEFAADMTAVAASAGDSSKAAAASKQIGAAAAKAAAAADPAAAAANPAFEKAGANLTAACKAAGVNVGLG